MNCRRSFVLVGAASTVAASFSQAQNLLVNGGFEAPDAGAGFVHRNGSFGAGNGWTIIANLDHIGGFWAAAEGHQSVDLNGSSAGGISQSFATTPGKSYRLRYAASENLFGYADKSMDVKWNGSTIESVVIAHDPTRTTTNMKWAYRERRVIASSPTTTLVFQSTTGNMDGSQGVSAFYGPAIDDVSVVLGPPCPCDLNFDGYVDDVDFSLFIVPYDILDCADPTMPAGCPADFNGDGFVDDLDFVVFVPAYNDLLCP